MIRALTAELDAREDRQSLGALHRALDLESLWNACVGILDEEIEYHSCSLLLQIVDREPKAACHHIAVPEKPRYVPATSLSVSRPFLDAHPQTKIYSYSDVIAQDSAAHSRRYAQEAIPGDWNEFVHLAFWSGSEPGAVLSIRRTADQLPFAHAEQKFLRRLYPLLEAALFRVREFDKQRKRIVDYEAFLHTLTAPFMLVSADGSVLFTSCQAQQLADRWNRELERARCPDAQVIPRIPHDLPLLIRDPRYFGVATWEQDGPLSLQHVPGVDITVRIEPLNLDGAMPAAPGRRYLITLADAAWDAAGRNDLLNRLSEAERRVALLVAQGLRSKEIAFRISRSRRTVEFQLNSIYRKLQLRSRAELIRALH